MKWAVVAALLGAVTVALGAFGSHGLASAPANVQQWWEIAARYQFYHVLALLVWGMTGRKGVTPWLWLAGTLLFSGSLYLLALGAWQGWMWRPYPLITPLGGFLLMGGWLTAAGALWRNIKV